MAHADRQYETSFQLKCSRRPWAEGWPSSGGITGERGFLWHATWYFRADGYVDLRRFWEDTEYRRDPIILVCADSPHSLDVSFAAVDDSAVIADTIGHCFDAALSNWRPSPDELTRRWIEINADLDPRVHTLTPWTVVADRRYKISMFGA